MIKVLTFLACIIAPSVVLADADIMCAGDLSHKAHQISLDRPTRTITYDESKYKYTRTGNNGILRLTEFTAPKGKRVVIATGDTFVGFIEFTGNTKTDYGHCYPQVKV